MDHTITIYKLRNTRILSFPSEYDCWIIFFVCLVQVYNILLNLTPVRILQLHVHMEELILFDKYC